MPRPEDADRHAMRQEKSTEVAEPRPEAADRHAMMQEKKTEEAAEEKKTDEYEDKCEYNEDDEAWWRLYRQEMPWEEDSSLSRGQKSSRRRRFQKAVAATREEKARVSSVRGA